MGRPRVTNEETVPIKIKKSDYVLIRTIASWKDVTALEYLSEIIAEATSRYLPRVQEEMAAVTKSSKTRKR